MMKITVPHQVYPEFQICFGDFYGGSPIYKKNEIGGWFGKCKVMIVHL